MLKRNIPRLNTEELNLFLLLIFFILLHSQVKLHAEGNSFHFQYLTIDDGLSQSSVTCLIQDSKGFLWFGTEDGLNKYDGYNFFVYYYDQDDSNNIYDNWINSIFEDKSGTIWIGSNHGLNRYNYTNNSFDGFFQIPGDSSCLSNNSIQG